jgi:hypothetical protein
MFDLTQSITTAERQRIAGAIKAAAKAINACPDAGKRWEALRVLRVLQDRLTERGA